MILPLVLASVMTLTVEDYATMPTLASPRLSPDGKRVAYVVTQADLERSVYDADIHLVDADGRNSLRLTSSPLTDNHPRWSPDGKRLAFLSDRDGRTSIWTIDPDGGEAVKLSKEPTPIRSFEWSPDGKTIAFTRMDAPGADEEKRIRDRDDARVVGTNQKHSHLYLLEPATGASRKLTSGSFSVITFSWSPDGKAIVFDRAPGIGLDDFYKADLYLVSTGDQPETTPLVVRPGLDREARFSPDGKWLAFNSSGGVDDWLAEVQVYVAPVSGGKPRMLTKDFGRAAEDISWTADGKALWFGGMWNTTSQIFRVGADGSGFTNVSGFAGMVQDADIGAGQAVFVRQSLTEAPEIFITDLAKFAPRQLTRVNDAFAAKSMGETRLIRWKHPQDGLKIDGFLTLPPGYKPGKRVPLLTFVHGGPASRFDQAYLGYLGHIYAPQTLAANGFAVFRPNPRGTGGYGEKFRQANRNDWGGKDWEDINAGIDKLIADGIADPDRLGLMGWSYGGFMASWAIGHGNRFKAISIGAPVVDLVSMHGTTDIRDFLVHYFNDGRSDRGLSMDLLRSRSPLWTLRPTKVPILIQHGDSDDRVPLSQGTMLYRFLDEMGADVTMVIYPRTPHIPREPRLRMDVARRNVEFFTRSITVD